MLCTYSGHAAFCDTHHWALVALLTELGSIAYWAEASVAVRAMAAATVFMMLMVLRIVTVCFPRAMYVLFNDACQPNCCRTLLRRLDVEAFTAANRGLHLPLGY